MKVVQDTPLIGFGAVERVVELDLARTPILEITVAACTAHWALKVNDGALVDLELESDANRTGVLRYDLRPILKHGSGPVKVRIFAVGDKSSVTVQRLRLLSADGQSVPPLIDRDVDCFRGMKVVEDLRGRFPSDVAAYRWALDDLMPLCTKRLAFCAGHNHGDSVLGGDPSITLGLDYPIAQKAFVFNLSPGGVPFGYNGKDYPGYPEQAKLFDEIMSHLDRPAGIYGWSEPEFLYCERVSRGGNFVVCSAAPNTSFWAKVPARKDLHLPSPPPRKRPLEAKYYITFQTNEGDTPKILAGLMSDEWISPKRGSVPIAWGIDPYTAQEFPALFEYYATTATPNDSFFAGASGAGYTYPWHMPNLDAYARHVRRLIDAYGPDVVDVWESGLHLDKFEQYQRILKVACLTQQTCGAATNNWLADGTPVISADSRLYYYQLDAKDPVGDIQRRIEAIAASQEPPYFILCYGGLGYGLPGTRLIDVVQGVQSRLPADKFEIVGMQDMAVLARQAGQFSVALDRLGVAPGGTVEMTLSLRNPDGKSGSAGRVDWALPEGWRASEARWDHGPVPPHTTVTYPVTLTAGIQVGPVAISCTDSRSGAVRGVRMNVYAASESLADFSPAGGWKETGATLAVDHGVAKITTPAPFSSIRKTMEIDFDREPVIEIKIGSVGGLWGLKVNDGTLPVDVLLQGDTNLTGWQGYDLSRLVGWKGKRKTEVILFAIQAGTSVSVEDMRLQYRK
jgi:hypothetical protein